MFVLRFTQPRQKIPFVKRNHIERNGNPSPSKSLKKESKYSSHKSNNAYKQQQQNNNFQRSKTPNNMVIQTSKPESTYVNTSIADENTSAKFSKSMTEQIESLVFYFKTFGEAGNDEFELAFQEAFHRDFVLESTKGNMNLKELFVMVKALRSRGSLVEVLDSIDNGDGTATLTIRFTLGREESPDVVRRRYWFHDGKAIRAACLKSDQFDNVIQKAQIRAVAELQKQMIACFDGSSDAYAKAEPIIDQLCHVDYVMEAGDGSKMNLQQFKSWAKGYADARNVAKLLTTEVTETGIKVWIQNTVNGEDLGVTEQVGTVQDGKIVHWKAVKQDAKSFSDMIEKVRAQDKSTEIKEVARTFTEDQLSCFDGSPDAYAKVKPILDRLYDEKFVMETGDGSKLNLQQFQSLLRSFSEARGIAKPIKTELTSNGFHVWIQNAMNGEDLGVTEQVGTVQDGKIVYWKAVKQDSNSFLVLLDTVSQRADGMLGNVARLKAYLNALDGTSTAWERFEPHIDQVLSRDIVWVDETSDISMKRSEIVDLIKNKYIPNGGYPVLETVKDNGDNSLTVVIRNHFPGAEEGEATRQTLYYNSDDLIQKLVSSDFVGGTCQRIAALPKKE